MNRKFKVLGLGLLAALAVSAFAASSAFSNLTLHTGGHFTTDGPVPIQVHAHSNATNHRTHLTAFGQTVTCTEEYTGTVGAQTVTSVTITATYTECFSGANPVTVKMNGCNYTFTVRDTNASTLHNDVHFVCPAGAKAEVIRNDGACNITFPPQTVTNAATYTTDVVNNKHALTVDITAHGLTYEKHGLCEFLAPFGTGPHTGAALTGSATLTGTKDGVPVNITATGRNGH